jgi:DNA mismatch endonuclease (patch repair protein)
MSGLIVDRATSARLGRIRQQRTRPEILVRRALHRMGLRFRVHNRDLPGSPDLANRRRRFAIFVHGCFWHHHEGCRRATVPKRNRAFWLAKFAANRTRDRRAEQALEAAGFRVLTIWECEAENDARLHARLSELAP